MNEDLLQNIDFAKGDGLIPVVVQHADDGAVLMLGYANREAMEKTVSTGKVHFWSRSRRQLWLKGEKSGNYLLVTVFFSTATETPSWPWSGPQPGLPPSATRARIPVSISPFANGDVLYTQRAPTRMARPMYKVHTVCSRRARRDDMTREP